MDRSICERRSNLSPMISSSRLIRKRENYAEAEAVSDRLRASTAPAGELDIGRIHETFSAIYEAHATDDPSRHIDLPRRHRSPGPVKLNRRWTWA